MFLYDALLLTVVIEDLNTIVNRRNFCLYILFYTFVFSLNSEYLFIVYILTS